VTESNGAVFSKLLKLILWAIGLGFVVLTAYMALFLRSGDQYELQSTALNETRNYSVYLPKGYDPSEQYPVVYSLDGEKYRHSAIFAANARMMAALGFAPDTIVVAVHTMGMRGRDYRPSFGAEAFVSFLERELIPQVEQAYPTSDKRVLSGHSFGGLFALYAMTTRPNLFEAYFAYDPSVLRDDALMSRLSSLANVHLRNPVSLYMNYGFHTERYEARYRDMVQVIASQLSDSVRVESSYYPLPHSMIMLPGQIEAMGFAAGGDEIQPQKKAR